MHVRRVRRFAPAPVRFVSLRLQALRGLPLAFMEGPATGRRLRSVLGAVRPEEECENVLKNNANGNPVRRVLRSAAAGKTKPLFLIAQMSHETNTYSPVPTDLARFAGGLPGSGAVPLSGPAVAESFAGTRSGVGAFLELAEQAGADVVTPISASAPPSGTVQDHAFEYICDAICNSVMAHKPHAIFLWC